MNLEPISMARRSNIEPELLAQLNKQKELKSQVFAILNGLEDTEENRALRAKVEQTFNEEIPSYNELVVLEDVVNIINEIPTGSMNKQGKANLLAEILQGAHVRINDGGKLYEKWSALGAESRISSHPSKEGSTQYGINGPWVHEVLFGVLEQDVNGGPSDVTFFQLENSAFGRGFGDSILHCWDYILYKTTGDNQGPYGGSSHTDSKPISLDKKDDLWVVND